MGNKNLHVKQLLKFTSEKLIGSHPQKKKKKKKKATSQVLTVINDIHIQFVLLISTLLRQDDIIYELKLAIQYYYVKLN